MPESRGWTVSIVGVSVLFGILAGFYAWLGPFLAPNAMPMVANPQWPPVLFHGFAIGMGVVVSVSSRTGK